MISKLNDKNSISNRINSIDWLRGFVLVLMALDHSRFFFLKAEALDIVHSSTALFITRLVSNLCAPVFVLLAGVSVRLVEDRKGKNQTALRILKRGLWLILLEFTIVRFGFGYFSFDYIVLQVIFAIGFSMVLLSAVMYLPKAVILALSLAVIGLHNLLDNVNIQNWTALWQNVFMVAHISGQFELFRWLTIDVWYPQVPWFAVMFAGYLLGGIYVNDVRHRRLVLAVLAAGCIAVFAVLRGFGIYGSSVDWSVQPEMIKTVLLFLKLGKYPPSLNFLLFNLGIGFALLAIFDNLRKSKWDIFSFFGRFSLIFYCVHLFMLSIPKRLFKGLVSYDDNFAGIFKVYVIWLIVVGLMYAVCKGYQRIKSNIKTQKLKINSKNNK